MGVAEALSQGLAPLAWLGAAAALLALAWSLWAAWTLARAGNPLRAGAAPRRFVDEGPFAWSRNPMALGTIVGALGLGLALGAPALGLLAAAALVAWSRGRIEREEAQLRQHFGGWYSDYAARVRRWV